MKNKKIFIIFGIVALIILIVIFNVTNNKKTDYSNPTKTVFESTTYQIEVFLKTNMNTGKYELKGEKIIEALGLNKDNYELYINNEIKGKNKCKKSDVSFKLVGKKNSVLDGYNSKVKCVNK